MLDHFHPPISEETAWEDFHSRWIVYIARLLDRRWLPESYRTVVERHFGTHLEVDAGVLLLRRGGGPGIRTAPALPDPGSAIGATSPAVRSLITAERSAADVAVAEAMRQASAGPDGRVPWFALPEVRLLVRNPAGRLIGAIELVSPRHKDRAAARDGFLAKMQTYLQAGVALVVVDPVTSHRACLHNLWADRFGGPAVPRLAEDRPHPVAITVYAPRPEAGEEWLDIWLRRLQIGEPLPTVPLRLGPDLVAPVELEELEESYREACTDLRLPLPDAA